MKILAIAGPTASGKSARGVEEALARGGEVISVDSRQVYRGLDIGTEKMSREDMQGVPHHLIDICDAAEPYSAGAFVEDATRLIKEITLRGKLPILVGGTHFYFDALLKGLPSTTAANQTLREALSGLSNEELLARIRKTDTRRAQELDPKNRRRLIRALEVIETVGTVPPRPPAHGAYDTEWIIIDPPGAELRRRIDVRLKHAFERGLIEEVARVREAVGDTRLNELGLEYRIIGELLRKERSQESLFPTLSAKLWQYAKRQKAWIRKLRGEHLISATS